MSEEAKGQDFSQAKRFVEIEAPERLEVGQNLYDQEPFSSLVKSIAESSRNMQDKVRAAISYFAKKHFELTTKSPNPQLTLLLDDMYYLPQQARVPGADQLKILETLCPYPYWSEYIVQRRGSLYNFNGSFRKYPPRDDQPSLTYANWVSQKLQREKRSWLVGIEEIFPREVGHPVTSHPNITGVKQGNRRFKILKAAEFIK